MAAYDVGQPLIIDPVIVFSTLLGGNSGESANDVSVDASGNIYLSGTTRSFDFPTVSPYQAEHGPPSDQDEDAFVAKLNANGSALLYSTFLGGNGDDKGEQLAVDPLGNAYITGRTLSTDFPTTKSFGENSGDTLALGSYGRGYVAKLSPDGSKLVYSLDLHALGIAVDSSGSAYITGNAGPGFPLVNPLQGVFGGGDADAYVAKVRADGSGLEYSTYLGGSGNEDGTAIALDAQGNIYIAGSTNSTNFPTLNAFQTVLGGPMDTELLSDSFVAKLSTGGATLIYSTYLGGSDFEGPTSLVADQSGNAYVAGLSAPSPRRSASRSNRSRASLPKSRARSSTSPASRYRSPPITWTTWPSGRDASRGRSWKATGPARPSFSSASPSA